LNNQLKSKEMPRGGQRPNAGRKTKAKELQLSTYAKDAIKAKFGSEQAFWEHIAGQSMESLPHLKLLVEYAYGKPDNMVKPENDVTFRIMPVNN
jgi:hypothetical protein